MAMIGITGYASRVYTVDNLQAVSLADMGFTDLEIRESDSVHVSHISLEDNAPTLYYWYTLEAINAEGDFEIKLPQSIQTSASNLPEGHPIFPGGERLVRGTRNIRNFRIIAGENEARIAVTIGTFGRTPVPN